MRVQVTNEWSEITGVADGAYFLQAQDQSIRLVVADALPTEDNEGIFINPLSNLSFKLAAPNKLYARSTASSASIEITQSFFLSEVVEDTEDLELRVSALESKVGNRTLRGRQFQVEKTFPLDISNTGWSRISNNANQNPSGFVSTNEFGNIIINSDGYYALDIAYNIETNTQASTSFAARLSVNNVKTPPAPLYRGVATEGGREYAFIKGNFQNGDVIFVEVTQTEGSAGTIEGGTILGEAYKAGYVEVSQDWSTPNAFTDPITDIRQWKKGELEAHVEKVMALPEKTGTDAEAFFAERQIEFRK